MQMKTTDDMRKVNTLPKFCHLTIISFEKCKNIMVGFKMQKNNFYAINDVL